MDDEMSIANDLSLKMRQQARVDTNVEVWWPSHCCSYQAEITDVSESDISLRFGDGSTKIMPSDTLVDRMAAAKVCCAFFFCVVGHPFLYIHVFTNKQICIRIGIHIDPPGQKSRSKNTSSQGNQRLVAE